jgi:hypothetical protein
MQHQYDEEWQNERLIGMEKSILIGRDIQNPQESTGFTL